MSSYTIYRDPPVMATSNASNASDAMPKMDGAALYGLVGDIVRTIEPHTESDPVAIQLQLLVMVGNAIGRGPYYLIESTRHYTNLFLVLVGDSSKARKGTSVDRIKAVMRFVDEPWIENRIMGGLSSGEGLIAQVRDPVTKINRDGDEEISDPGVADKRLMVVESEFAQALSAAERHGNTVSMLIRNAWDGIKLGSMTKTSQRATGAHVSICAHITTEELRARITRTDMGNGFANRFAFARVQRSKLLAHGGNLSDSEVESMGERLKLVIEQARTIGRVTMTDAAKVAWTDVYGNYSTPPPGLLGSVVGRAECQTIRLAMLYALLDGKDQIDIPHLDAALAAWEYCEASAAYIFGQMLGDAVADEILEALTRAGPRGMARTEINNLFQRHKYGNRISVALSLLERTERAKMVSRETGGRPAEVWLACVRGEAPNIVRLPGR